jgi:hypothetical protein
MKRVHSITGESVMEEGKGILAKTQYENDMFLAAGQFT